jgi:hypothetical protein
MWGYEPAQKLILRRLVQDMREPGLEPPLASRLEPPLGSLLFPTIPEIESYLTDPRMRNGVAVDLETAGPVLRVVGFCRLADPAPIVVWFHYQTGVPAWPEHRELVLVRSMVARCLADPGIPKWFHNGQAFDVPQLEGFGFEVNGYDLGGDTMVYQRHSMPEQPANLQWEAIHYLPRFPAWKHVMAGNEELEEAGK